MTQHHQQRAYSVPPASIIMVLLFVGISALFGALSIAYMYARINKGMQGVHVPLLFIFNTFVLVISSYCIQRCRKYFDLKNEVLVLRWGLYTLAATLLFLGLQASAWSHLLSQHISPGSSGGHGYLYAISILHFLHVVGGIPFLVRILVPLYVANKAGNGVLYFLNEDQKSRLKHTAWYWHFIDVMWVYLMIFFLVNGLV